MPDLTDTESAIAKLRGLSEVERQLPAIFESVADGVTVLDRSGIVRFANAAAARLMGRESAQEVIGQHSSSLTGAFDLLDEEGATFDLARLPTRRALAGEQDPEATIRFRAKGSAQDRWSLVRARLLRGGDMPDADLVVTSFQDITSLKQVERRLSFLSEASALLGETAEYGESLGQIASMAVPGIADWCVVDVLEGPSQVHRVAIAHSDPEMLALAEDAQRRWPPDVRQPGAVGEMLRAGRSVHVTEVTDAMLQDAARDADHLALLRRLHVREVVVAPMIGRGQVLGALTMLNTEPRPLLSAEDVAMVEELGRRAGAAVDAARLMWEAQESVRLRDEFMAIASHDMRTPLAAVRGYAQLARRHLTNDPDDVAALDRWLADIDASAERLTGLVSELMDVSLLRGGQTVPLQLQRTDLVALVTERVREHAGGAAETHQFSLSCDQDQIIGTWDPARLARVLDNILGNAVKFSPAGGDIGVRLWSEGRRGYVAVVDHGIGIATRDVAMIFTPTYRGANARNVVGSGLGLAASRRLIELMGGEITVDSQLGEGSTFTICLPLEAASSAATASVSGSQPSSEVGTVAASTQAASAATVDTPPG